MDSEINSLDGLRVGGTSLEFSGAKLPRRRVSDSSSRFPSSQANSNRKELHFGKVWIKSSEGEPPSTCLWRDALL